MAPHPRHTLAGTNLTTAHWDCSVGGPHWVNFSLIWNWSDLATKGCLKKVRINRGGRAARLQECSTRCCARTQNEGDIGEADTVADRDWPLVYDVKLSDRSSDKAAQRTGLCVHAATAGEICRCEWHHTERRTVE